jgi:flavorubredoxin
MLLWIWTTSWFPKALLSSQLALGAILKDPEARAKPCGVFGSFGWSGEAVDELEQRLKDGGFNFAFPAIRCKFKVRFFGPLDLKILVEPLN